MSMQERDNRISRRSRITLDNDQRTQYIQAITPFVLAVRVAYQPIKEAKDQLKLLRQEQQRIEGQIQISVIPSQNRHPLSAALSGIRASINVLSRSETSIGTQEEFRLKTNQLISEVNSQKAHLAVSLKLVRPESTALIGEAQIPPPERKNKFKVPESPVRPHNALGTLSIYRERRVRSDLEMEIRRNSKVLMASSLDVDDISLAMVQLVPIHLTSVNRSTPSDMRNSTIIARSIIDVAQLVSMYDKGIISPPTAEQLGLPGAEQDKHISTHLRALLGHYLRDELSNPNRTEKALQDFYQGFSNYIRQLANHITPAKGSVELSLERVGSIIENLPGIEGTMIASRLSTNLFQDLSLPCLDYMGELRIAEVLRNIVSSGGYIKRSSPNHSQAEYKISNSSVDQLDKVLESIRERIENDEIDCQKLFQALESLDYGEILMTKLFAIIDDDQKDTLIKALSDTNCFRLIYQLYREEQEEDY